MNTIETSAPSLDSANGVRVRLDPRRAIAGMWNALGQKIQDRRTLHQLYQLDAHVLRDMGFDPDAIYSAHESAIGDMSGVRRSDF
jgi:uncharacterized protein YjiS (DUF1127 family)